jgi:tetratricopeptide (TPR) repeat protein
MFPKRHFRLSHFALAIGVTFLTSPLTSPPKMPADDVGAAVDAFDRNLGAQRLDPDSAEGNGETVETTLRPEKRGRRESPPANKESSLSDLDEAIRFSPNSAAAYNNRGRGNIYLDEKQYDKALSDYNQAIRLDPTLALAYRNRGRMYKAQAKRQKADADFAKAEELNSRH